MEEKKFFRHLRDVAKQKVVDAIASRLGEDRLIINLNKLEDIPVEHRELIAILLGVDNLFEAKKYDLLIRLGKIEEFIIRGLVRQLIALYPKYREELGYEMQRKVNLLVKESMLETYIKNPNSEDFRFFIYHPLGLKVLAKYRFSGFIAANEKEFKHIADNFPEDFNISETAHKDYVNLLTKMLI